MLSHAQLKDGFLLRGNRYMDACLYCLNEWLPHIPKARALQTSLLTATSSATITSKS